MQLVEQHVIDRRDRRFVSIDSAAFLAKNLYNAALYLVRQSFIFEHRYLGYKDVYQQMKGHDAYRALPTKVAQQVLRLLDKNWQSYFAACEAYREDPSKFKQHPKLPHYKHKTDGRYVLVYTLQALSRPGLKRGLIQPSMMPITVQTKQTRIAQVRIVPRIGYSGFQPFEEGVQVKWDRCFQRPCWMRSLDSGCHLPRHSTRSQDHLCACTFGRADTVPALSAPALPAPARSVQHAAARPAGAG